MGNTESITRKINIKIISDKIIAKDLLDKAEHIDKYLQTCFDDKANYIARRSMTYFPNQISLRDTNYGITYLEGMKEQLPMRLSMELGDINIIQLMPTADGGMPHTRPGDIICYPDISQLFSTTSAFVGIQIQAHVHRKLTYI